jgi:hypothetical protein
MIERRLSGDPRFKDFFDFVFIDEKWFYLTQKSEKYYLLPEEDDPHRTCKNKNYIPRLMFLCVCARPRFRDGECIFDGRIGCFPLVTYEPAQRSNAITGRVRGDMVMKPITSITRDVIREWRLSHYIALETTSFQQLSSFARTTCNTSTEGVQPSRRHGGCPSRSEKEHVLFISSRLPGADMFASFVPCSLIALH